MTPENNDKEIRQDKNTEVPEVKKGNVLKEIAGKIKSATQKDELKESSVFKTILKYSLITLATLTVLFFIGYLLIFSIIQDFTNSATSNFHWIHGWAAGVISFLIAAALTKTLYVSITKFLVLKPSTKDYIVIALCIVLTFASAYSNRNKFFGKDSTQKEICPALIAGDLPTVKNQGKGEEEGLTCIPLTKKEAALALAIDRNKTPLEIKPKNFGELDGLEAFSNGAVAIYIGEAKGAKNKIYDGPGFNPRKLGILRPVSEDELIAYKAETREDWNRRMADKLAKEKKDTEEKQIQKEKTEASEKAKAEADKKEALRIFEENKKLEEISSGKTAFRQKFVDENTKKILLSSLNIKTYIIPDNYEVIQKTNGVTGKGNTIEVRTCFICKDDYVVIRPDNHYPIPFPPDSYFLKDKNSKSEKEAGKIVNEKQISEKPVHAFEIEMRDRDPAKESFTFSGGGKMEGNKVSDAGPIRIVSTSCLQVFISIEESPPTRICNGKSWTVRPGQIWKIINNENYSVYSKNSKVNQLSWREDKY